MSLIVEDGRCPAFANSYVSLEDADAYLVGRGIWPQTPLLEPEEPLEEVRGEVLEDEELEAGGPDDEEGGPELPVPIPDPQVVASKEAALIRAFDFLNTLKWKGKKPCWERTVAWPRDNVPIPCLAPVEYIEPDCVPKAVIQAQCELAGLIFNGWGPFAPLEHGGRVKSVSDSKTETVDVLSESTSHSVTYADNAPVESWLPSVYPLLAPFLDEIPGKTNNPFSVQPILKG